MQCRGCLSSAQTRPGMHAAAAWGAFSQQCSGTAGYAAAMRPTGVPRHWDRKRPKNQHTAEKPWTPPSPRWPADGRGARESGQRATQRGRHHRSGGTGGGRGGPLPLGRPQRSDCKPRRRPECRRGGRGSGEMCALPSRGGGGRFANREGVQRDRSEFQLCSNLVLTFGKSFSLLAPWRLHKAGKECCEIQMAEAEWQPIAIQCSRMGFLAASGIAKGNRTGPIPFPLATPQSPKKHVE